MDIQSHIIRQRVQHIVDSYQLDGSDGKLFADYLTGLLATYPQSLVELALTEALVRGWSEIPMKKGMPFIQGVHKKLRSWQSDIDIYPQPEPLAADAIETILTPEQFEQITGLDASLVFDQDGRVLVTWPMGMQKPLEPQS
ncbi:hypothetical protein IQ260_00285 [Leptolyngbya cf. ectocarpi LEGE 11479]|uniref:Uncharacterized protein n=1 Tax=Leptolyngbya cf. ectocarpi LEGE 11479 TaxID=1828722 RepID=A0A928WXC5_LEPEC|nr:hypothetical protein [Leptolyngbya ectocarpi]MBE9065092.1 hypothetical protein [Leptolyngbya cf. ectocarpi LEGE 11479]